MKFNKFVKSVNEEFDCDVVNDWVGDINELKSYRGVVFVGSSGGMIDDIEKKEGSLDDVIKCLKEEFKDVEDYDFMDDVVLEKDMVSLEESVYYWLDGK